MSLALKFRKCTPKSWNVRPLISSENQNFLKYGTAHSQSQGKVTEDAFWRPLSAWRAEDRLRFSRVVAADRRQRLWQITSQSGVPLYRFVDHRDSRESLYLSFSIF